MALGLGALAVALGPGALSTHAGRSPLAATVATLALAAAAVAAAAGPAGPRVALLALAASFCWTAPVWFGWSDGPPLVRALGALTAPFLVPVVALWVVRTTGGQWRKPGRALVAVAVLAALVRHRPRRVRRPAGRSGLLGQLHRQRVPRPLRAGRRGRPRPGGGSLPDRRRCRTGGGVTGSVVGGDRPGSSFTVAGAGRRCGDGGGPHRPRGAGRRSTREAVGRRLPRRLPRPCVWHGPAGRRSGPVLAAWRRPAAGSEPPRRRARRSVDRPAPWSRRWPVRSATPGCGSPTGCRRPSGSWTDTATPSSSPRRIHRTAHHDADPQRQTLASSGTSQR